MIEIPWTDATGFAHMLSVQADKSVPTRRQERILGKLWERSHEYITNMESPVHGPNWKLAVNGGTLHVLMGQRAYTLVSAKPHPTDGTFTVQVDADNMLSYRMLGEVAKAWISEALYAVM